jgi:hypothetical protein
MYLLCGMEHLPASGNEREIALEVSGKKIGGKAHGGPLRRRRRQALAWIDRKFPHAFRLAGCPVAGTHDLSLSPAGEPSF